MNRMKCLIMALTLCVLFARCIQAESSYDLDGEEETAVTIVLTKLDVNDTNLKLSWKIKNDTDHDVWVCDRYSMDFERFMDKDAKTLVLRRRYNLSNEGLLWEFPFPRFRYSRLRPDQEKVESLSLTLPVRPWTLFSSSRGNAESAKRLAIEIGFYDEDLPELILNIVEMAEKLSCDTSLYSPASPPMDPNDNSMELSRRFFGGVFIARFFNLESFTYFRDSVTSGGDEIITPYLWQTLNGEQILRIEVDGVSIPYDSVPAAAEPANDEQEDTPLTIALTKLDVNDQNLDLSWKIKNNTDYDVWVCDSVSGVYSRPDFEVYLAEDAQTLVIRKRLDISPEVVWASIPVGRYVRLRPGQERAESLSLAVPVRPRLVYIGERANAESARRLVLEIGFYNEDLLGLIRGIIEVAERLGCANLELKDHDSDIIKRYFKGLLIKSRFGGLSHFDESHKDVSEQFLTAYTDQLLGEQALRIVVDDVSIPYEGNIPLFSHGK